MGSPCMMRSTGCSPNTQISAVIRSFARHGRSARARRPFTTSRRLSRSHRLPTGAMNCFGFMIVWHSCFSMKTSRTTHSFTSNKPSQTRSTTHTTWALQRCFKLRSGVDKAGSKRLDLRLLVQSRSLRRLERRGMQGHARIFSRRSKEEWKIGTSTEIPAVSLWK